MKTLIELTAGYNIAYASERRKKVYRIIDERLIEMAVESHDDAWYEAEVERVTVWLNQECDATHWAYCDIDTIAQRFFDGVSFPFAPEREAERREKEQERRDRALFEGWLAWLEDRAIGPLRPANETGAYDALLEVYAHISRLPSSPSEFIDVVKRALEHWQFKFAALRDKAQWEDEEMQCTAIHALFYGQEDPGNMAWQKGHGQAHGDSPYGSTGFSGGTLRREEYYIWGAAGRSVSSGFCNFPFKKYEDNVPMLFEQAREYCQSGIAALQEALTMTAGE